MKKLAFIGSAISFLLTPVQVLADDTKISITKPPKIGFNDLSDFMTNALTLIFTISLLLVLIMLIWGAFEWITSGGDKETVAKARGRIINALIGLAILAIAFALTKLGSSFVGLDITKLAIPSPAP